MAANGLSRERLLELIAEHEAGAASSPLPMVRERHVRAAEGWRKLLEQNEVIFNARDERLERSRARAEGE